LHGAAHTDWNLGTMFSTFDDAFAALPAEVKEWVTGSGLTDHVMVADSVTPEYLRDHAGVTVVKPVDIVFVATVATALPEIVKKGAAAWAKTLGFYQKWYAASTEAANKPPDQEEVTPIEAKDPGHEEWYELNPECREKRLKALFEARRRDVEDARLPSGRLWGRCERLRRVQKECIPLLADKVQSEEIGKNTGLASFLGPVQHGALAWKLPAMQEAPPGTLEDLETWAYIIENRIFLTWWVEDINCLEVFHQRFWARVRKNRAPRPGCWNLSVAEYCEACLVCQNQWHKASTAGDKIDDAINASLPPENGDLDVALAVAPRLAAHPRAPALGANGGVQAARPGAAGSFQAALLLALAGAGQPAAKRRRLSKAQRRLRCRLRQLAPAAPERRGDKGKAAGMGKPSGAGKKDKGARKGNARARRGGATRAALPSTVRRQFHPAADDWAQSRPQREQPQFHPEATGRDQRRELGPRARASLQSRATAAADAQPVQGDPAWGLHAGASPRQRYSMGNLAPPGGASHGPRRAGTTCSGIAMVDYAARLHDPAAEREFDAVDANRAAKIFTQQQRALSPKQHVDMARDRQRCQPAPQ
ncbi:unnamed protein product, partial [Prorocentrum cordatum]